MDNLIGGLDAYYALELKCNLTDPTVWNTGEAGDIFIEKNYILLSCSPSGPWYFSCIIFTLVQFLFNYLPICSRHYTASGQFQEEFRRELQRPDANSVHVRKCPPNVDEWSRPNQNNNYW